MPVNYVIERDPIDIIIHTWVLRMIVYWGLYRFVYPMEWMHDVFFQYALIPPAWKPSKIGKISIRCRHLLHLGAEPAYYRSIDSSVRTIGINIDHCRSTGSVIVDNMLLFLGSWEGIFEESVAQEDGSKRALYHTRNLAYTAVALALEAVELVMCR